MLRVLERVGRYVRDNPLSDLDEAFRRAHAFARSAPYLDRESFNRQSFPAERFFVEEHTTTLTWSDDVLLYEFRIVSHEGRKGFVICAVNASLPPILEYGFAPNTLTESIWSSLCQNSPELRSARSRRYIYLSGIEIYVEVDDWLTAGKKDFFCAHGLRCKSITSCH